MVSINGGADGAIGQGHVYDAKDRQQQHAERISQTERAEVRRALDDPGDRLLFSSDATAGAILATRVGASKESSNNPNRPFEFAEAPNKSEPGKGAKDKPTDRIDKEKPEKTSGVNPLQLSGALVYRSEDLDDPYHVPVDPLQTIDSSQTGYFESASGKIVNVASGRIINVVS